MRRMPSEPANTPMARKPSASGMPRRADARLNVTATVSSRPKPPTSIADSNGSVIRPLDYRHPERSEDLQSLVVILSEARDLQSLVVIPSEARDLQFPLSPHHHARANRPRPLHHGSR